jgi:endonuclease/exonuclease/phosphatase family metal-dependent hydrolase
VTWNVLWRERAARQNILVESLREASPDVVFLQETSPAHASVVAAALGMCLAAVPATGSTETTSVPAILTSEKPVESRVLSLPRPLDLSAVSAVAEVEGVRVRLISTHLRHTPHAGRMGIDVDYRSASLGRIPVAGIRDDAIRTSVEVRLAQLEALRTGLIPKAPDEAVIIGGDFNFVPDGVEYRMVLGWGLSDSWRAAPRLGSGATIIDRNPLIADGRRPYASLASTLLPGAPRSLDYTLDFQFHTGPGLAVEAAWIIGEPRTGDGVWPSDHLGIVAEYDLLSDPSSMIMGRDR